MLNFRVRMLLKGIVSNVLYMEVFLRSQKGILHEVHYRVVPGITFARSIAGGERHCEVMYIYLASHEHNALVRG